MITEEIYRKVAETELFLFDMDGTLWLGNRLYEFTPELLRVIREKGKKYLFITNNSSKSTVDYVKKLAGFGIEASPDDFMTSAEATARYLTEKYRGKRFYVCGTASMKAEFARAGIDVTEDKDAAEAIVLGFDTELDFKKLHDVSYLLCTKDLPYYATNPDLVCPTEFGSVPDCGSVSGMLRNVSGKMPVFIGKPSPLMIELAMEKVGVPKEKTTVVGDRIYTDVKSGLNAGAFSILVMSGETDERILAESPDKPDAVMNDCGEILEILKA